MEGSSGNKIMENEEEGICRGESEIVSINQRNQNSTFWSSSWKSMIKNTKKISNNLEKKLRSKELGNGSEVNMLPLSIPHLSPLAHSVISRCSR